MAGKTKEPLPRKRHECCLHIAAITAFNAQANGMPGFICQLNICCHCGQTKANYVGVTDTKGDHGSYTTFQGAPIAPKLALPGGHG